MKILLVCTSGGHFATMKYLEPFWSHHERVWVTDHKKDTEELNKRHEKVYWLSYQGPREIMPFLANIPRTLGIIAKEKPDLIISTGASIAVNFSLAARIFGKRFIFVESITRSKELSLSAKLVYFFCNELYVQWPDLPTKYPKAMFKGYV
ncbi:MAG: PssD/Cps14F family polysaccharide biosynthesis glycosyltransferase [Nostocaceae cyanobacterium]|nr:PssD/Cps14F family polysaccharide biosynthesis glycosyltransferase [Nostocaceae cyanobacterium]